MNILITKYTKAISCNHQSNTKKKKTTTKHIPRTRQRGAASVTPSSIALSTKGSRFSSHKRQENTEHFPKKRERGQSKDIIDCQ